MNADVGVARTRVGFPREILTKYEYSVYNTVIWITGLFTINGLFDTE